MVQRVWNTLRNLHFLILFFNYSRHYIFFILVLGEICILKKWVHPRNSLMSEVWFPLSNEVRTVRCTRSIYLPRVAWMSVGQTKIASSSIAKACVINSASRWNYPTPHACGLPVVDLESKHRVIKSSFCWVLSLYTQSWPLCDLEHGRCEGLWGGLRHRGRHSCCPFGKRSRISRRRGWWWTWALSGLDSLLLLGWDLTNLAEHHSS